MQPSDARRLLGVDADASPEQLRLVYRRLLLRTHPDLSGEQDATERTIELTHAYDVLVRADAGQPETAASATADSASGVPPEADAVPTPTVVVSIDETTIGVAAPADETLFLLIEAANRLGEITYLDPSAGLIELIVEFVEAPTSSVVLSMQGRATGTTEVFCTVEPLSGGEAPPADAVTRLLERTLREMG